MTPDQSNPERRRVAEEIIERLRGAGVTTTYRDSPEDLVRLLDAVEDFEHTVERKGGDLMVDEPIGEGRPTQPDDAAFVLPPRDADEPIAAYIDRIAEATSRAGRAPRRP
ncbi:MAG TPA: hypothetical protein VGM67_18335 [Gemmatimonadaceae bacterium]|jgi:hypothetical protein